MCLILQKLNLWKKQWVRVCVSVSRNQLINEYANYAFYRYVLFHQKHIAVLVGMFWSLLRKG